MRIKLLGLVLCGAFATVANAAEVGVYVNGGTTGFGLGVASKMSENVGGRLGFDTWKKSFSQSDSDGNYTGDLKLQTVGILGDWYPFAGTFRTTLGLIANGNKITLTATPSATATYTFNGVPHSASEVGSYNGEVKFNSTAPYLGIGWGNPVAKDKTWGFVADIGIMFQGSPKVTSTVTCAAAIVGNQTCTDLKQDVKDAEVKLENDMKDFKYWPVISIGVSYHF